MVSGPTLPKYMVVEIINLPIVDKLGVMPPLVKPTVAKAEVLSNNKSKKLPSSVRLVVRILLVLGLRQWWQWLKPYLLYPDLFFC